MTKRPCSPGLEALLFERQSVLDDNIASVTVVDYMGNDDTIAHAARLSYGVTDSAKPSGPLIRRLMRDRHTSPFEHCEITLHVKLPIFVARQWLRHRTANVNEVSGRYTQMETETYSYHWPDLRMQSQTNEQGTGGELEYHDAKDVVIKINDVQYLAWNCYREIVDEAGEYKVAREQARIVLPLSTYTEISWKIDLHNLLHFLDLRCAPDAQLEIRAYAEVISGIVKTWVPETYSAWLNYRKHGVGFSRDVWAIIWKHMSDTRGIEDDLAAAGIGKSETAAVMKLVRDEPV